MESSTCSRRSASRRARAQARWPIWWASSTSTRPVRARPRPPLPVGTPAAAGLQNTPRAGHEETSFPAVAGQLPMRKPSFDTHPNVSPNLTLVPFGPWACDAFRSGVFAGDDAADAVTLAAAHGDGSPTRGVLAAVTSSPANARRANAGGGCGKRPADDAGRAEAPQIVKAPRGYPFVVQCKASFLPGWECALYVLLILEHCGADLIAAVKAKRRRSSVGSTSSDASDDAGTLLRSLQSAKFPSHVLRLASRIIIKLQNLKRTSHFPDLPPDEPHKIATRCSLIISL